MAFVWWVSLALVHAVGFFRFLCEGRVEESKAQQVMFVVLGKEVLHVLFGSSGTPFIMTNNDTKSIQPWSSPTKQEQVQ